MHDVLGHVVVAARRRAADYQAGPILDALLAALGLPPGAAGFAGGTRPARAGTGETPEPLLDTLLALMDT